VSRGLLYRMCDCESGFVISIVCLSVGICDIDMVPVSRDE
jgi:hypothetical protein